MSCNCKKKPNSKYIDNDELGQTEIVEASFLSKIGNAICQFFFGILIGLIIIIGIIPFLLYIIFNICIGKETEIRIPNIQKHLKN